MGIWTVLWVVLLGLVLWGVMRLLARRPGASSAHVWRIQSDEPSALEILNRRYARGELDSEEYEEMRARIERAVLTKGPPMIVGR
jgi:putative membrane protein